MRRAFPAVAAAIVALFLSVPALAQESAVQIDEFSKDGAHLKFKVLTPGGPLLTSDNFRVSVNDIPADGLIALGGTGVERPAGAALVLDTSGSMKGRPIAEAKKAARLFLTTVDPSARVSLVSFSTSVRQLTGFSSGRAEALDKVRGLRANGETALYDAVIEAVSIVQGRPSEQRNIVLLSDGGDTVSDAALGGALDAATSAGVSVFAVGLRSPEYNGSPIKRLAERTSGSVFLTGNASRLPSLFEALAKTLVSSYEVSVVNPDPRASLMEVEVEVLGEKAASGTGLYRVPSIDDEPNRMPALAKVPLPIILLVVFLGAGVAVFLASETVREARTSPAERVIWYSDDGSDNLDRDALIQSAVLNRAKELATQFAARTGLLEKLEREIDAAGMKWRPGEVIVASVLLSLALGLLGFALRGPSGALLLAGVALLAPTFYIRFNSARRRSAFVAQLSDVLTLIAGALRAGYSLQQALAAVGEDAGPPASEEFRRTMAEVRLGASMEDALRDLARRVDVVDFNWTVMAIEVQREVGGDLAEILEIIAGTIRERERLRRHIRALTAEGRLSGIVLGILPFAMAAFLLWRQPDYLEPLYTTGMGLLMIGGASFLMIVGALWMRKIVRIEV
jgi:tight adherence protein B